MCFRAQCNLRTRLVDKTGNVDPPTIDHTLSATALYSAIWYNFVCVRCRELDAALEDRDPEKRKSSRDVVRTANCLIALGD